MQRKIRKFTSKTFNYTQDFKNTDFRKHPERYQVGIGEQGVLMVEPYKSEILQYWRFKDEKIAEVSAKKIYTLFKTYKKNDDFVGMDMARKFLQMGYTRSRRYANHPTGRKYVANPQLEATPELEKKARLNQHTQAADWGTSEKAKAARVFYGYYKKANLDPDYDRQKKEFKAKYG